VQVVLISDFASLMGCQMGLKPAVTAITFVALGTSLPDTFASMAAARGDKYADNSIGAPRRRSNPQTAPGPSPPKAAEAPSRPRSVGAMSACICCSPPTIGRRVGTQAT
jgi:hypothetical protein